MAFLNMVPMPNSDLVCQMRTIRTQRVFKWSLNIFNYLKFTPYSKNSSRLNIW